MKKHVDRLKVMFGTSHVGTLASADRGQLFFEYTPEWLATGFDLAPRSLAFNAVLQKAKDPLFDGLHGVFNDSLPDGWGLLLMDREFNKRLGWSRHQITPLDRLAYMGSRAAPDPRSRWLYLTPQRCVYPAFITSQRATNIGW